MNMSRAAIYGGAQPVASLATAHPCRRLEMEWFCEDCDEGPFTPGNDEFYEEDNTSPFCFTCHERRYREKRRLRGSAGCAGGVMPISPTR